MNDPTIKIQQLRLEHMEQVIDLLQHISAYRPAKHIYTEIWNTFSAQSNVYSVVALENTNVIGYGSIVIEIKIRGGKMGHVEDIVTSPAYRNREVGRSVMMALFDIAIQNGCYKVALQCQPYNINFYKKCNYDVSGTTMQRFILS